MFNTHSVIEVILILAGAGQLALALSSLAIPYLLDWREELQALAWEASERSEMSLRTV